MLLRSRKRKAEAEAARTSVATEKNAKGAKQFESLTSDLDTVDDLLNIESDKNDGQGVRMSKDVQNMHDSVTEKNAPLSFTLLPSCKHWWKLYADVPTSGLYCVKNDEVEGSLMAQIVRFGLKNAALVRDQHMLKDLGERLDLECRNGEEVYKTASNSRRIDYTHAVNICRQILSAIGNTFPVKNVEFCNFPRFHAGMFVFDNMDRLYVVPCKGNKYQTLIFKNFYEALSCMDTSSVAMEELYSLLAGFVVYWCLFGEALDSTKLLNFKASWVPTHTRFKNATNLLLVDWLRCALLERQPAHELSRHAFFTVYTLRDTPPLLGPLECHVSSEANMEEFVNKAQQYHALDRMEVQNKEKKKMGTDSECYNVEDRLDLYVTPQQAIYYFRVLKRAQSAQARLAHEVYLPTHSLPFYDLITCGRLSKAKVYDQEQKLLRRAHDYYFTDALFASAPQLRHSVGAKTRIERLRADFQLRLPTHMNNVEDIVCHACRGMRFATQEFCRWNVELLRRLYDRQDYEEALAARAEKTNKLVRESLAYVLVICITSAGMYTNVCERFNLLAQKNEATSEDFEQVLRTLSHYLVRAVDVADWHQAVRCQHRKMPRHEEREKQGYFRRGHSPMQNKQKILGNVRYLVWCFLERVLEKPASTSVLGHGLIAYLRQFLSRFSQAWLECASDDMPRYIRVLLMRTRDVSTRFVTASSMQRGLDARIPSAAELRDVPRCCEHDREHVQLLAARPFQFMSLMQSSAIMATFQADTMTCTPLLFRNSFEKGDGKSVSNAMVLAFFRSVFEEHSVFEAKELDDGTTMYDLSAECLCCNERAECSGCTSIAQHMAAKLAEYEQHCGGAEKAPKTEFKAQPFGCQLFCKEFFDTFGKLLNLALREEIDLPYRLSPRLLHKLFLRSASESDTMSFHRTDALNAMLSEHSAGLADLCVAFGQNDTDLCAENRFDYLAAQTKIPHFCVPSALPHPECTHASGAYDTMTNAFTSLPMNALLQRTCGHSLECFSAVVRGHARAGADSAVDVRCQTMLVYSSDVVDYVRRNYVAQHTLSSIEHEMQQVLEHNEDVTTSHATTLKKWTSVASFLGYLRQSLKICVERAVNVLCNENEMPKVWKECMHRQFTRINAAFAVLAHEETTKVEAPLYVVCKRVHNLVHKNNELLALFMMSAFLKHDEHSLVFLFSLLDQLYIGVVQDTMTYYHRWLSESSEEERAAYMNACTAKLAMPEARRQEIHKTELVSGGNSARAEVALEYVTRRETGVLFGVECGDKASELFKAGAACTINCTSKLLVNERNKRIKPYMCVYVCSGGLLLDASSLMALIPHFNKLSQVNDVGISRNLIALISQAASNNNGRLDGIGLNRFTKIPAAWRFFENYNSYINRPAQAQTCAQQLSLYAYESYEHFKRALNLLFAHSDSFYRR